MTISSTTRLYGICNSSASRRHNKNCCIGQEDERRFRSSTHSFLKRRPGSEKKNFIFLKMNIFQFFFGKWLKNLLNSIAQPWHILFLPRKEVSLYSFQAHLRVIHFWDAYVERYQIPRHGGSASTGRIRKTSRVNRANFTS